MSEDEAPRRAHLIAGGFPRGSYAGHDIDAARLRILTLLQEGARAETSVANDFLDLDDWLDRSDLLVTYVAGPHPDPAQCEAIEAWMEQGGRWLALHGTSGGRTVPLPDGRPGRMMKKAPHHATLGCFFLNHPPIRRFAVDVAEPRHPLTEGLAARFEVEDELYLLELEAPDATRVLLTTADLPADDPAPRTFGFTYDADTSIGADGRTRALGYVREFGHGGVAYVALGHCHTPTVNIQPFVDESVSPDRKTPLRFAGPWGTEAFERLLRNGIDWGLAGGREA